MTVFQGTNPRNPMPFAPHTEKTNKRNKKNPFETSIAVTCTILYRRQRDRCGVMEVADGISPAKQQRDTYAHYPYENRDVSNT
jgi:hypothetical protein